MASFIVNIISNILFYTLTSSPLPPDHLKTNRIITALSTAFAPGPMFRSLFFLVVIRPSPIPGTYQRLESIDKASHIFLLAMLLQLVSVSFLINASI